jgi:hypothetical protein
MTERRLYKIAHSKCVPRSGENRLLASLTADDVATLRPHLRQVELRRGNVLHEPRAAIERVYFDPTKTRCRRRAPGSHRHVGWAEGAIRRRFDQPGRARSSHSRCGFDGKRSVAAHAGRAKLRAMHPCVPRLRDQFGPIHPAAGNDNLPAELRPRKLRQALASVFDEPGG